MTNHTAIRNQILNNVRENIAELENCKNDDFILAFDNGLGVRFLEDEHTPAITTLDRAECIGTLDMPEEAWAYTPIIKNGAGEQARVIRRQAAIAAHLPTLRDLLAGLENLNSVN